VEVDQYGPLRPHQGSSARIRRRSRPVGRPTRKSAGEQHVPQDARRHPACCPSTYQGAGGACCRLSPAQLDELQVLLDVGPAVWSGRPVLNAPRIAAVVRERLGVAYTVPGVDLLLPRLGWS
jgi:hypothetical protein